jgi:cytochrome c peroxidase
MKRRRSISLSIGGLVAVGWIWGILPLVHAQDPRDPNRLSVASLEAAIQQHDTETSILLRESSLVWDQMRQALVDSTPADRQRRVLRNFDSERGESEQAMTRYQALLRSMIERQLAVAESNNGNAFGSAVPFFLEMHPVLDQRTNTSLPIGGNGAGVYIKSVEQTRRRTRSSRSSELGELDLAIELSGVEPADVSRVRVSLRLISAPTAALLDENIETFDFEIPHIEPVEPLADAPLELPVAHAGQLRLEVAGSSLTALAADDLETLILSGSVILRVEVSLGSTGGFYILESTSQLFDLALAPDSLKTIAPPMPLDIADYVRDEAAAIALGKALFWDVQVSSPNTVACASCHSHAGADTRITHQYAPSIAFGAFPGTEQTVDAQSFPLGAGVVLGSQGVVSADFIGLDSPGGIDLGIPTPTQTIFGGSTQVDQRNSPTVINAAFNDRQFWDGRATREFNGVNIWGDRDVKARVYSANIDGSLQPTRVSISPASLASQAVGPVLSHAEMSWMGRSFPDVGRKLLGTQPLAKQQVHSNDSVLGPYVGTGDTGLNVTYEEMIQAAFQPEWWSGVDEVELASAGEVQSYNQREVNFSLFFGLAVMLYERTLISDDSRYDQWKEGRTALSIQEQQGLELFLTTGSCIACHTGPEFSAASYRLVFPGPIELMPTAHFEAAHYDDGFYNIGVTTTAEDLGVGGDSAFGPLSYTRQEVQNPGAVLNAGLVVAALPTGVDGAFKTPTIRNAELTGPFMHNGKFSTLQQVVEFYARGSDFPENPELSPEIGVIPRLLSSPENREAVVAFMKTLTDDRVRWQRAPFDHPSLEISNGNPLPAVGRDGQALPLKEFASQLD